MDKTEELENEIKALKRRVDRFTYALDEVRRRTGLSSIIDEQLQSIDARGIDRGRAS